MAADPAKLLTLGLRKGFAGETKLMKMSRFGFQVHASHLETEGAVYHDEWAADRTGGGQELVKVDDMTYTRVYAGGTISYEALKKLEISKKEVIAFLVQCLVAYGELTRLHESFGPQNDGDWTYQYSITDAYEAVPLTVGKEEIFYQDQLVFVHVFCLTPVE